MNENLCDYISQDEWPASSSDLNPLDFCIWGYMLSQIKFTKNIDLAKFKSYLVKIWVDIQMEVIRAAGDTFSQKLQAIIKEIADRFELKSKCKNVFFKII